MKISAGIVMYRYKPDLQLFLAHPGGPHYTHKDEGCWEFPKGGVYDREELLDAALREFHEETGITLSPTQEYIYLGEAKTKRKRNIFWGTKGDFEGKIKSNIAHNKKLGFFPEMDKAEWYTVQQAKTKIRPLFIPIIEKLVQKLGHE